MRADGSGVVGRARAVGGADFAQRRPGLPQDVGHPETPADLDQLSARHHDLASLRQRRQHQQRGGGVVVDDDGRVGASELTEPGLGVDVAPASTTRLEIELEAGIAAANRADPIECGGREWRPAEVRMENHARGVDDAPQPRLTRGGESSCRTSFDERSRVVLGGDGRDAPRPRLAHDRSERSGFGAQRVEHAGAAVVTFQRAGGRALSQAFDGGNEAGQIHDAS